MEAQALRRFENKEVKLDLVSGFNLRGRILNVYEDCILFETTQATSIINIDQLRAVVEVQ